MLMEGDPFLLIEGMAIAGGRGRRDQGLRLYPLRISARLRTLFRARSSRRARAGLLGAECARLGPCLRSSRRGSAPAPISAARRLAARKPRGQARAGARQAAAAGDSGPVRQADGHQQRAELRLDAMDSRTWREGLRRLWRGPLARHAAVPARRQYPPRRPRRTGVRRDASANSSRISAAARESGGRSAPCRSAARSAPISRDACSTRRSTTRAMLAAKGMLGHGGIVVFDDTRRPGAPGALRLRILRQGELRQMHALPHRLDARRRDGRQDHRRPRTAENNIAAAARSLRGDDRRLALRARRPDAAAGAERARPFPRGFRHARQRARRRNRSSDHGSVCRNSTPARRSASAQRR